jgi:hypothetical protein
MASHVFVLEQIVRTSAGSLERIERRTDATDRRINTVVTVQHSDFG